MTDPRDPFILNTPVTPGTDLPGNDIPAPSDPVPGAPDEAPITPPTEAPRPDLPPETRPGTPPVEVPQDLPGDPPKGPTQPDIPEELPQAPAPNLPPEQKPQETPVPVDPGPLELPQEIPINPGDTSRDDPPEGSSPEDLHLRSANPLDAGRLGEIITEATLAATWKPRLHSSVEDIAHAGRMIDKGWITVAELDQRTAGFIAREGSYIHSLFIAGFAQGRGVGKALLDHAKTDSETLELWTFADNTGALRFYDREGFTEQDRTDGAQNDEGLPDVRLRWTKAPRKVLTAPTQAKVQRPA